MGIQGLWPLLKDHTNAKHIRCYRGKRVAVDTYAWLHKAVFGCCIELATGKDTNKWIIYCLEYIDLLLREEIEVYLVFDGGPLPAKRKEEDERRLKRAVARSKGLSMLQQGNAAGARAELSKSIDVSPLMAAKLINVCREQRPSVKCIVAPYEADAQMAYLCHAGIVDAVITEDSDLVPYRCPDVITKLEKNGSCQCIVLRDIYTNTSSIMDFRSFSTNMMVTMCVAAGCDYLKSLDGIGVKKSYRYVSRHRTIHRLLRALRFEGLVPLVEAARPLATATGETGTSTSGGTEKLFEYELEFYKAVMTFFHQTVFDPITRKVRPLLDVPNSYLSVFNMTDINGGGGSRSQVDDDVAALGYMYRMFLRPSESESSPLCNNDRCDSSDDSGSCGGTFTDVCSFLGPHIDDITAGEIADGRRDPETMAIFDLLGSSSSSACHLSFLSSSQRGKADNNTTSSLNNRIFNARSKIISFSKPSIRSHSTPHMSVHHPPPVIVSKLHRFMSFVKQGSLSDPSVSSCSASNSSSSNGDDNVNYRSANESGVCDRRGGPEEPIYIDGRIESSLYFPVVASTSSASGEQQDLSTNAPAVALESNNNPPSSFLDQFKFGNHDDLEGGAQWSYEEETGIGNIPPLYDTTAAVASDNADDANTDVGILPVADSSNSTSNTAPHQTRQTWSAAVTTAARSKICPDDSEASYGDFNVFAMNKTPEMFVYSLSASKMDSPLAHKQKVDVSGAATKLFPYSCSSSSPCDVVADAADNNDENTNDISSSSSPPVATRVPCYDSSFSSFELGNGIDISPSTRNLSEKLRKLTDGSGKKRKYDVGYKTKTSAKKR